MTYEPRRRRGRIRRNAASLDDLGRRYVNPDTAQPAIALVRQRLESEYRLSELAEAGGGAIAMARQGQ